MVVGYLLSYGYVLLILLMVSAAAHMTGMEQESRRKLIHIFLIFDWCIMLRTLGPSVHLIVIPCTFVLLNLLSYLAARYAVGWKIPVLSSMERPAEKETPGTVYYAASFAGMGVLTCLSPELTVSCGIGLFCMAFGDGLAGVIGERTRGWWAGQWVRGKSIGGSLTCVVGSIAGCSLLSLLMGYHLSGTVLLLVGIGCAVLELPGKGLDNLTVPFGSMLLAQLLLR